MSQSVVVTATIRPGKHDRLAEVLAAGPPFDLTAKGFTRHRAYLGSGQLVLVFEGDHAATGVRALAASLPVTEMARVATLVSSPQVLTESYEWDAAPA